MSAVKLRIPKHVISNCIRTMTTVSQENTDALKFQSNNQPFYLFPIPKEVTPPFELVRTFSTAINKMTYYFYERDYSDKKFINGAKVAITQMAKVIRENDIEAVNELTLKQFSNELREKMSLIPQEVLQKRLSFTEDNIVHAFIHSLIIAPKEAFNIDPEVLCFYGKVIAIIDQNSTQQVSLNKALKNAKDDTLFCNVT